MPRRLLRDGVVVLDDWRYLEEAGDAAGIIIPFDRWNLERESWARGGARVGVLLGPAHRVEQLAGDLVASGRPTLSLIAAEFSSPAEGRGYTQGRLLRERFKFAGELRAVGYVRRDQLFFMARCGFNSFELPEAELEAAGPAMHTFSAAYQPAGDAGLDVKLRHRRG